MITKTYHIVTFGCQMNAHDSEKLAGILQGMGYTSSSDLESAGLVVFNTCCIRENAENRLLGHLGIMKHKKEKGRNLIVAVGGCMPQQESAMEALKKNGTADIIFGTHNLHLFGEMLKNHLDTGKSVTDIWLEPGQEDFGYLDAVRESPWRSGVNIMYGCDNYCSYCVVPYVRGRERSRKMSDIMDEIRALINDGVMEIMLLGQNVNSYGKKSSSEPSKEPSDKTTFPELLKEIVKLNIPRIRFMTSHPKDLSLELIQVIRDNDNICRHIHLPVQSGSNRVLDAMNRKYTRQDYLKLIEDLRREIPDIMITTDIIVGFPGETEDDFEDTLDLVRQAGFGGAFTFIYSKRNGTKAASMDGHILPDVANQRFTRLLDILNPIALEINKGFIGQAVQVLVELFEKGKYTGRAGNNLLVHFTAPDGTDLLGNIVNVRIVDVKTFFLLGELID